MANNHPMYGDNVAGAPPHPPVVPQAVAQQPVVQPPAVPQAVVPQAVVQQPVVQQPVDNNIAGAPPPAEPLFIGPQQLLGPRLQPIEDIVANDLEIRRICSELATILNNLIGNNKENLMNLAGGVTRGYYNTPYQLQQYTSPPISLEDWGIITLNTILQQVNFYVRMATHPEPNRRQGFNFPAAIVATEISITDITDRYNRAVEHDNINRANSHGFFQHRNAAGIAASVTLGAGSIGGIFTQFLQAINTNYGGNLRMSDVRPYCDLILQLYRRIQTIIVENGFQQGGNNRNNKQRKSNKKQRGSSKKQRRSTNKRRGSNKRR